MGLMQRMIIFPPQKRKGLYHTQMLRVDPRDMYPLNEIDHLIQFE